MVHTDDELNICVISVWFGRLPSYLPYFIKTCTANTSIHWLLISDQPIPSPSSENIRVMGMSKISFTGLASKRFGFDVTIEDPYKVCDFKPLFGKIFEDQLKPYKYWGYCDLDIVFGDISKHIQPLLVKNPDVVSFYPNFLSGPFCLYKNTQTVNKLFMDCPTHQSILQDPCHRAFDENIPWNIRHVSKLFYRVRYVLKLVFMGPRYHFRIPEIRYNFQWYAKKLISHKYPTQDMTEVVHKANSKKIIKAVFKDLIKSDRMYMRQRRTNWKLLWQDNKLIDSKNNKDIFAYHFVESKNRPSFDINPCIDKIKRFSITENKIECEEHVE